MRLGLSAVCLFFAVLAQLGTASARLEPGALDRNARPAWNLNANVSATEATTFTNQTAVPFGQGYYDVEEAATYLASQLRDCIVQSPSHHGLFFHIEDLNDYEKEEAVASDENEHPGRRNIIRSMYRGIKRMPADQRMTLAATVIGSATVPLYLTGSAVAYNEMMITNEKDKALALAKAKLSSASAPPSKQASTPPVTGANPGKRSLAVIKEYAVDFVRRNGPLPKAATVKLPKEANPAISRGLAIAGLATSLMYIPAGVMSAVKALQVRESDTTAYKRSVPVDMPGFTVTCIPVQKTSAEEYTVPEGALVGPSYLQDPAHVVKRSLVKRQVESDNVRAVAGPSSTSKSSRLTKIGRVGKLLGIAYVAGLIGNSFQTMSQKRDLMGAMQSVFGGNAQGQEETVNVDEFVFVLPPHCGQEQLGEQLEKRLHKFGKGSIFIASFLAGSLLSKAGAGVPDLPPVVTPVQGVTMKKRNLVADRLVDFPSPAPTAFEQDCLSTRGHHHYPSDTTILLNRRSPLRYNRAIAAQIHKGLNDKVAITFLASALGFASIKSGAAGIVSDAVIGSKGASVKNNLPSKRDLLLERFECVGEEEGDLHRREPMGKVMNIVLSFAAGAMIAQHTGTLGQIKENKVAASLQRRAAPPSQPDNVFTKRAMIPAQVPLQVDECAPVSGTSMIATANRQNHTRLPMPSGVETTMVKREPAHHESLGSGPHFVTVKHVLHHRTHKAQEVGEKMTSVEGEKQEQTGSEVAKKKMSTQKKVALAGAGAVGGFVLHNMYINSQDQQAAAAEQAYADAYAVRKRAEEEAAEGMGERQVEGKEGEQLYRRSPLPNRNERPVSRSRSRSRSPSRAHLRGRSSSPEGEHEMGEAPVHHIKYEHHYHDAPKDESQGQLPGGAKKKSNTMKTVGLVLGGAAAGVVAHGLYNKSQQAAAPLPVPADEYVYGPEQTSPVASSTDQAEPLAKRSLVGDAGADDGSREGGRRETAACDDGEELPVSKRGRASNAVFGVAVGVAAGAWYYGQTRDWPGIRKERKVSAQLLAPDVPQRRADGGLGAAGRLGADECSELLLKRAGTLYNAFSRAKTRIGRHTPAVLKKGKVQGGLVIAAGIGLSTLGILTEPPMMEWKGRNRDNSKRTMAKEEGGDSDPIVRRRSLLRTLSTPFRPLQQLHTDVKAKHGSMASEALIIGAIAALAAGSGLSKRERQESIEPSVSDLVLPERPDGQVCYADVFLLRRGQQTMTFEQKANAHIDVWALAGATGLIVGNVYRTWKHNHQAAPSVQGKWLRKRETGNEGIGEGPSAFHSRPGSHREEGALVQTKHKTTVMGMPRRSAASLSLMLGAFVAPLIKPYYDKMTQTADKTMRKRLPGLSGLEELTGVGDAVLIPMLQAKQRWQGLDTWPSLTEASTEGRVFKRSTFEQTTRRLVKRTTGDPGSPRPPLLTYGDYYSTFKYLVDHPEAGLEPSTHKRDVGSSVTYSIGKKGAHFSATTIPSAPPSSIKVQEIWAIKLKEALIQPGSGTPAIGVPMVVAGEGGTLSRRGDPCITFDRDGQGNSKFKATECETSLEEGGKKTTGEANIPSSGAAGGALVKSGKSAQRTVEQESDWVRRQGPTAITFTSGRQGAAHFEATMPTGSIVGGASKAKAEARPEEQTGTILRRQTSSIQYDGEKNGNLHFKATMPSSFADGKSKVREQGEGAKGKGHTQSPIQEAMAAPIDLSRREEPNIRYDTTKEGATFRAVLSRSATLDSREELLKRGHEGHDHHQNSSGNDHEESLLQYSTNKITGDSHFQVTLPKGEKQGGVGVTADKNHQGGVNINIFPGVASPPMRKRTTFQPDR